jgi:hypothetical protein
MAACESSDNFSEKSGLHERLCLDGITTPWQLPLAEICAVVRRESAEKEKIPVVQPHIVLTSFRTKDIRHPAGLGSLLRAKAGFHICGRNSLAEGHLSQKDRLKH